jgi:hypothetical protein
VNDLEAHTAWLRIDEGPTLAYTSIFNPSRSSREDAEEHARSAALERVLGHAIHLRDALRQDSASAAAAAGRLWEAVDDAVKLVTP